VALVSSQAILSRRPRPHIQPGSSELTPNETGRPVCQERPASPFVSDIFIVPDVSVDPLRVAVVNHSLVASASTCTRPALCRDGNAVGPAFCVALTLSESTVSVQTLFRVFLPGDGCGTQPPAEVSRMALLSRAPWAV